MLTLALACSLTAPAGALAGFYRYVTDDGQIHCLDDLSRVPENHLDQIKTYRERCNHLPEQDRAKLLQRDREQDRRRTAEEDEFFEQAVKEPEPKHYETDVIIQGNQVPVPVTTGRGNRSGEALFLLDTGATHLVVFKDFAGRLDLTVMKKGY